MGSNDPLDPVYPPPVSGPPNTPPKDVPPKGRPWIYGVLILAVLLALALLFRRPSEGTVPDGQGTIAPVAEPPDNARAVPDSDRVEAPDTAGPALR